VWNKASRAQLSITKSKTLQQENIMNKSYLTAVLTLTCLLGAGISARAQDIDKVVVNVPFEFVAGGHTLPAGTYSVSRVSDQSLSSLVIRSYDNTAFLLPMFFDGVSADQADLGFEHVGDKYYLSKIQTSEGVYVIRTPRAMTQVAQSKDHGTGSSAGAN
jgi:hypothetical protein